MLSQILSIFYGGSLPKEIGDYKPTKVLGEGSYGVVYQVTHQKTGSIYALKSISKSAIDDDDKMKGLFKSETDIMSKINHPNILHLHEWIEDNDNYYLVVNFCNGGDLATYTEKTKGLGEAKALFYLKQILEGFKALHKHNIMHRDVKLENMFLHDGKVVIGDFGYAKVGVTEATTMLGTPATMAPEVYQKILEARGILTPSDDDEDVTYNNKADLWSVGACFYMLIYGTYPFKNYHAMRYESGHDLFFPTNPPVSEDTKKLLRVMLEPEPQKRIDWREVFDHKFFKKFYPSTELPEITIKEMKEVIQRVGDFDWSKLQENTDAGIEVTPIRRRIDKGYVYQGQMKQGKRHGAGVLIWDDGSRYEGEWQNGQGCGYGRITQVDGSMYEGHFKDSKYNGWGKYYDTNGSIFEGEWADNFLHGQGKHTCTDGHIYEGEFQYSMKYGKGTSKLPDGSSITGSWVRDQMENEGTFYLPDGSSMMLEQALKQKTKIKQQKCAKCRDLRTAMKQ